VSPHDVPVRNFRVRRRRNGEVIWLLLDNYCFVLDELTDVVWRACDGESTIAQLQERVEAALSETPERAAIIVSRSLEIFCEEGLLDVVSASCPNGGSMVPSSS